MNWYVQHDSMPFTENRMIIATYAKYMVTDGMHNQKLNCSYLGGSESLGDCYIFLCVFRCGANF